jgi:hypothetical protein
MARFHGIVGYAQTVESKPGVFEEKFTERSYFGDVVRNTRQIRPGEQLNDDLSVGNSISIVADAYAREHFFAIRYVEWQGVLWLVPEVEVQHPRLLLRLGGVYSGRRADGTSGA